MRKQIGDLPVLDALARTVLVLPMSKGFLIVFQSAENSYNHSEDEFWIQLLGTWGWNGPPDVVIRPRKAVAKGQIYETLRK